MHVRDLLELATVVASHATTSLNDVTPIPASSLESYWAASKARLDRWGHGLKRFSARAATQTTPRGREISWLTTRPIFEEIFLSEVLTRVWTAILLADDRRRDIQESEPIGRSVLVGHLEARHRALNLLVHDSSIDVEQAVSMNRVRRRTERWTDLLIGGLLRAGELSEFAFNPTRARQFFLDLSDQERSASGNVGWSVALSAMRGTFGDGLDKTAANPDLNAAIANSILGWWSPAQFDATGLLRSAWLARMSVTSDDTEQLIDDLFAFDERGADSHSDSDPARLPPSGERDRFRG